MTSERPEVFAARAWLTSAACFTAATVAGFAGDLPGRAGFMFAAVAAVAAAAAALTDTAAPRWRAAAALAGAVVLAAGALGALTAVWWPAGADPTATAVLLIIAGLAGAVWWPAVAVSVDQPLPGAVGFAACALIWLWSAVYQPAGPAAWAAGAVAAAVAYRLTSPAP